MTEEMGDFSIPSDSKSDSKKQELLDPARIHPDELILPDLHPTRFPGTWVCIFEGSIPNDQRNALRVEGFKVYRINLLENRKAQVVIRENPRPDRDGSIEHEPTKERYEQYEHPGKS